MKNILNKENGSVCKHPKKEYLLGIRKLMAIKVQDHLTKTMPHDTAYLELLTKYTKIERKKCD